MADTEKRKSVAFAEGATVVDDQGSTTEIPHPSDSTAAGHSQDASVDEMTTLFSGLAKKKKKPSSKKKDEAAEDGGVDDAPAQEGDIDLSALKKKKKKKAKAESGETGEGEETTAEAVQEGDMLVGTGVWEHGRTEQIGYSLLLDRFFTLLHDRHPEAGQTKSYKIPPPQCLREGNKKTIFANLPEIAKRLNRSEEHITSFLFAEMGTSGSTDGSRRLVIKGRFQAKQIENILRRYIQEYVSCKTCRSLNTTLSKGENRLWFLTCENCGSTRTVTAISRGFSAQIGKRKRQQG